MTPTRIGSGCVVVTMLIAGVGSAPARSRPSFEQDMINIERLHQRDKEATLSDSADQLAALWDKDAVRFLTDRPAEIGAAAIYADDKKWELSTGRERTLCVDMEIQDVKITGDWAFEWAYGSGKIAKGDKVSIQYSKVLRVMKRQSDGTWRFARVMGLVSPLPSAVVLKHPCQ